MCGGSFRVDTYATIAAGKLRSPGRAKAWASLQAFRISHLTVPRCHWPRLTAELYGYWFSGPVSVNRERAPAGDGDLAAQGVSVDDTRVGDRDLYRSRQRRLEGEVATVNLALGDGHRDAGGRVHNAAGHAALAHTQHQREVLVAGRMVEDGVPGAADIAITGRIVG